MLFHQVYVMVQSIYSQLKKKKANFLLPGEKGKQLTLFWGETVKKDNFSAIHTNFNGALLTAYLYLLYPYCYPFKKWTRLDAQQSMAKQPSRMCGKSVSEKSE